MKFAIRFTQIGLKSLSLMVLAFGLIGFAEAADSLSAAEPPNIVYILADDLGYGDLACYNAESKIPTSRLDRLATQGMRFTDAHSPSSVCTPTRYALLTGRYAWRTRLQRNVLGPWDKPLIAADRLTVGKLLQQHGYETACIGKWHLGQNYTTTDGKPVVGGVKNALSNVDFTKPIGDGPTARGFDHYFGTIVPNYPPYCFIEDARTVGIPSLPASGNLFNIPGPMVPNWKLENILPELTNHAVRWIEKTARSKKPFFLYLSLTSPHYPVVPAPDFFGKTKVGHYGDFVYQTDGSVGQVLDALDRAGVSENTLVIFTSDNGPEITGEVKPGTYDRAEEYGHRSSGDLRGAKRDAWEGGHRVPFIARWPKKIEGGKVSNEIICHVDLMATVAGILGVKLPDDAAEDSVNILPVLLGEQLSAPIREATVHHSARGKFAIRQGDWVLIDAPSGDDNGANGEPMWLKNERGYTAHTEPGELFNLREDLSQRRNLYKEKAEIVSQLRSLLNRYMNNGRSTPGLPQKNDTEILPFSGTDQPPKINKTPKINKPAPANKPLVFQQANLEESSETSANASVGDLDGDGDWDIVLAKGRHWPLLNRILINDGQGRFHARNLGDHPDRSYAAVLGDIDNDGDLDIVVSNDNPDPKVVYKNFGNGDFVLTGAWGDSSWNTRNLTVADVNGDHFLDLVVANRKSRSYVILNDGKGNYRKEHWHDLPSESATTIVAADLNGDGLIDLAIPHRDGGVSQVLFNDDKMSFQRKTNFGPKRSSTRACAAGDLNGDGKIDLILGDDRLGVMVCINDGDGEFPHAISVVSPQGVPYAIAVSDMNRDQRLDLVVGYSHGGSRILLNDGTGTQFEEASFGDATGAVYGIAIADLNNDGKKDIVQARSDAANTIFFQTP